MPVARKERDRGCHCGTWCGCHCGTWCTIEGGASPHPSTLRTRRSGDRLRVSKAALRAARSRWLRTRLASTEAGISASVDRCAGVSSHNHACMQRHRRSRSRTPACDHTCTAPPCKRARPRGCLATCTPAASGQGARVTTEQRSTTRITFSIVCRRRGVASQRQHVAGTHVSAREVNRERTCTHALLAGSRRRRRRRSLFCAWCLLARIDFHPSSHARQR
jgi:hypothetical protein